MSTRRTVEYIVGATVLVAWLASAAGVPRPQHTTSTPRPAADEIALDAIAADVQSQAARLRQRMAAAPAPQVPLRNPFTFDVRDAAKPRVSVRSVRPVSEPLPDPGPPDLPLALLGIAERKTQAGVIRTAIIGGDTEELHMVGEGQELAGRYRVIGVSPDAVELKDLLTGATRRLALK
jgi:hypothetical protein